MKLQRVKSIAVIEPCQRNYPEISFFRTIIPGKWSRSGLQKITRKPRKLIIFISAWHFWYLSGGSIGVSAYKKTKDIA
jgi:hypothetical protein